MALLVDTRRRPSTSASAAPAPPAHRPDIQGLRAVSVLVVVAYHAGVPFLGGGFVGVDLFFVVSGFVITQLLLHEIGTTGTVDLMQFWARRARRLIPTSTLVLVSTVLAARHVLSPLARGDIGADVVWSALFSGNWRFAQQRTDYLAGDRAVSPVLHFWSLGVEEQFYLVWPVLLVALAVVWRLLGHRRGAELLLFGGAFSVVIAVSFAYCVRTTAVSQPYAYFGTPSRAWQLAAGALTALLVSSIARSPRRARVAAGLAGLGVLGLSVHVLHESGSTGLAYPSWLALLPTTAGVLLLAANAGGPTPLGRVLSIRPLTYLGDLSYPLYLWHFPVLVIGAEYFDPAGWLVRTALVLGALALSIATHHLLEDPLRRARLLRRPAVSVVVGASLAAGVVVVAGSASTVGTIDTVSTSSVESSRITPSLDRAEDDAGPFKDLGCHVGYERTDVPAWDGCTFGDRRSKRRVLVLGDSIATAIAPGVIAAGQRDHQAVTVWAKSRCPMADVTAYDPSHGGAYLACDTFRENALRAAADRGVDVVVIAMSRGTTDVLSVDGSRTGGPGATGRTVAGLQRTVDRLERAGVRVVLSESPTRAPFLPDECLAEHRDVQPCRWRADRAPSAIATAARRMPGRVTFIDPNTRVCPDGTCEPVVGDIVSYRDQVHFTRTFALTLADDFAAALAAAERR